jgi:hypothetical protein
VTARFKERCHHHVLRLWHFENLTASRMHKHNLALMKIQLAISILGQFDFDSLRRVVCNQLDPHTRSGCENIPHSSLKL